MGQNLCNFGVVMMPIYYKLLNPNGIPANGGSKRVHYSLPNGRKKGAWMPRVKYIEMCGRGYHVVEIDHVLEWYGTMLYKAEIRGQYFMSSDKIVAEEIRLVSVIKGWNDKNLRLFAADCAEHVPLFGNIKPYLEALALMAPADAARAAAGDAAMAAGAAGGPRGRTTELQWQVERLKQYLGVK